VCPTGIDIRDGLQLECVNCTACIDACDDVMIKINKPTRLIGFYSSKEIEEKATKPNNTRAIAYTVVMAILISILDWLLFSRSIVGSTLLRAKGTSYQVNQDGTVSNLYNLELINKSSGDLPFELQTINDNFEIKLVNPRDVLKKGETAQFSFFLYAKSSEIESYKTNIKIKIVSGDKTIENLKTTFVAPVGK